MLSGHLVKGQSPLVADSTVHCFFPSFQMVPVRITAMAGSARYDLMPMELQL